MRSPDYLRAETAHSKLRLVLLKLGEHSPETYSAYARLAMVGMTPEQLNRVADQYARGEVTHES